MSQVATNPTPEHLCIFVRNDSLSYDTIRQVFQEFLQETKTM